ncbi:hypothetical protein OPQ81_011965 [Rhizoctonia solani]|nr:hypothetical protein OPQ81_011965 [Rhizoctonia solani]
MAAIENGDCLPNTFETFTTPRRRRALLVAIRYETDGRDECKPLPENISNDLLLFREGLVPNPLCDPTKENILESFGWLVQGARPGEYRYFHFSGSNELEYYDEAILTYRRTITLAQKARVIPAGTLDDYNRIRVTELESFFPQLPEGCTLTVTLDQENDEFPSQISRNWLSWVSDRFGV